MNDALAPNLEDRLSIEVTSTADPGPDLLLLARSIIQSNSGLQDLFLQAQSGFHSVGWLKDMLVPKLEQLVPDDFSSQELQDLCQFLADEYSQLSDGHLLVSTETGRAVMVVAEGDLYNPGILPREGGGFGQALSRLKPEIETALVLRNHTEGHEQKLVDTLAKRGHQTALLRDQGNLNLRIASTKGRASIARDLQAGDALELLERSGGTTGMFLRHFTVCEANPESTLPLIEGEAVFKSTMNVVDGLSVNLGYNRLGALKRAAPQGWIRDIARLLSDVVSNNNMDPAIRAEDLTGERLGQQELWIADPDTTSLLHGLGVRPVVPVTGARLTGMSKHMGRLEVSRAFQVETHERAGKWEVIATLSYKLFAEPTFFESIQVTNIPRSGEVVG